MISRRRLSWSLAVALCAVALSACGSSGTKTVSVANTQTPPPPPTTTPTSTSSSSTSTSSSSTSGPPATATASSATGSTRTASGPAFAQTTSTGTSGPESVVMAHGYTPVSPSQYNPQDTLQVLVGSTPSGAQKAFFFVNGSYIGTDTALPSGSINVISTNDTEVTLGYALFHPDGSSAGTAQVTYALNNGMLGALGPIPSALPSAAVSRR